MISTIVAAAIPERKKAAPKEAPKLAKQDAPKAEKLPESTAPEVIVPAPPPPEAIVGTPEARRAERAAKIAERMEARLTRIEAERAARGSLHQPNSAGAARTAKGGKDR